MPAPKVIDTPLAKLHPAEWNPRTIRDERFKNLCASIEADPEFLWRRPILATADGTIYAGNMRYRAAAHLKLKTVPAIVEDVPENLAKERALRDNAQWGDWNDDQLAEMVYQMAADGSDVKLLGIEEDELARLLSGVGIGAGLTDPDELPENVPTRSKPGDLWLLGEHRVLCGDATSAADVGRALGGAVPNLMVTDPPYGVDYDASWRQGAGLNGPEAATGVVANDDRADWSEAWELWPGTVAYVWHGGLHGGVVAASLLASNLLIRAQIIWVKQRPVISRGSYHWQHEPAFVAERDEEEIDEHEPAAYAVRKGRTADWWGGRKQSTVWFIEKVKSETGHSTQKPVECMARPIRNHKGDVYDPFLGSGTTLIACEQLGRKCYGLEIAENYVDVIVQRWQNFTGRAATLEATGETFDSVGERVRSEARTSDMPRQPLGRSSAAHSKGTS